MDFIIVAAQDAAFGGDVVGEDPVAAFAPPLFLGVAQEVVGFGGEADDEFRARFSFPREALKDIRRFFQFQLGARLVFFDFVAGLASRTPIADRRHADGDIHRQRGFAGFVHLGGAFYILEARHAGRFGGAGPADEQRLGAHCGERFGDGVSLFA